MPNLSVIAISGSPSPNSKTALAAQYTLNLVAGPGIETQHLRLNTLNPEALLRGDMNNAGLAEMVELFNGAHGVIVATPIFKSSLSGLLKSFLDILPQFGLAGKVVLPMATGGSLAHVLALDYGLRPIMHSMAARHVVQGHFLHEPDLHVSDGELTISAVAEAPLLEAISNFKYSLTADPAAQLLGNPRPALSA